MSTKIYNGFCINASNLKELEKFRSEFIRRINPILREEFLELCGETITDFFDALAIGNHPCISSDMDSAEILKRVQGDCPSCGIVADLLHEKVEKVEKSNLRDPLYDFSTSVSIFLRSDYCLAMLFSERQKVRDEFENISGVKEYGYWDNTDHPERLTEEEWKSRGKVWDEVLGPSYIPSLSGLTIESRLDSFPRMKDILPKLPSLEKRIEKLSEDNFINFYEKIKPFDRKKGNIWEYIGDCKRYRKDEGKAEFEALKAKIAERLKPITESDLMSPFPAMSAKLEY